MRIDKPISLPQMSKEEKEAFAKSREPKFSDEEFEKFQANRKQLPDLDNWNIE